MYHGPNADETKTPNTGVSRPEGKLTHVLSFEGEDDLEGISAAKGMVTRLKATIEVRAKTSRVGVKQYQHVTPCVDVRRVAATAVQSHVQTGLGFFFAAQTLSLQNLRSSDFAVLLPVHESNNSIFV